MNSPGTNPVWKITFKPGFVDTDEDGSVQRLSRSPDIQVLIGCGAVWEVYLRGASGCVDRRIKDQTLSLWLWVVQWIQSRLTVRLISVSMLSVFVEK